MIVEIFPVTMPSIYRALLPTDDKQATLLVFAALFWWFFAIFFSMWRNSYWGEICQEHAVGIPPSQEVVKKAKDKKVFWEWLYESIMNWTMGLLLVMFALLAIEGVIRLHLALYEGIFN